MAKEAGLVLDSGAEKAEGQAAEADSAMVEAARTSLGARGLVHRQVGNAAGGRAAAVDVATEPESEGVMVVKAAMAATAA